GFEESVRAEMQRSKIPGLTIGFVKDDYVWVKAFGVADLENGTPMTEVGAYRFASVQKSMTAAAVLQLVEQKKIDLNAEIQTYVPYFPRKPYPITIRQLLGHLGGIPHYVDRAKEQHFKEHKTVRETIAIFENFPLVAEPGTKWVYSTYGYDLLGAAIENVSKQSYGDYMRDHVWRPAGMTATMMDDALLIIPHRVRGYQLVDGEVRNSEFVDISSRFAGGGTRGTVPDLLRFMKALNDGKLISEKSLAVMYMPMKTRSGERTGFPGTEGYAMGWNVTKQKLGLVYMNDGGQQETRTFIINVPSRHFAIAFAMNLESDSYGPIFLDLYERIMGEPFVIAK
ncbi:MAG TPA: serine hydrolase domain-containing protein, partial [Thermoanaerobaculia bacterium]|nr:serine hydrolase domain-containing protein [Thermoanaerobaculia bacterium]